MSSNKPKTERERDSRQQISRTTTQPTGFGFEKPVEGRTNDWLTPPELVKRLGHFDLDPCGCAGMPWRLADTTYFLPEHDGLVEPWRGRVFCNPPYGPNIEAWAARMAQHRNGIFLIFSRTETDSWSSIWQNADAMLFTHGRTSFYLPNGDRGKSGPAPSTLIAFGENNVEALRRAGIAGALVRKAMWIDGTKISKL